MVDKQKVRTEIGILFSSSSACLENDLNLDSFLHRMMSMLKEIYIFINAINFINVINFVNLIGNKREIPKSEGHNSSSFLREIHIWSIEKITHKNTNEKAKSTLINEYFCVKFLYKSRLGRSRSFYFFNTIDGNESYLQKGRRLQKKLSNTEYKICTIPSLLNF